MSSAARDPWLRLGTRTMARIALGRAGASLPTREVLAFSLAHARARDAVHATIDRGRLAASLAGAGLPAIEIESEAHEKTVYLRRPDLGRRLTAASRDRLQAMAPAGSADVALMIGDGLSATAVEAHAPALVLALLPALRRLGVGLAPIVLARGARVALGDEVGALLRVQLIAVLIGERPGLSAADSMGVYLTFAPGPGRTDAERNCISNVRPDGLSPAAAAHNLAWLIEAALARGLTGVGLKDESPALPAEAGGAHGLAAAMQGAAAQLPREPER